MIEKIVIDYLHEQLDVAVKAEVPADYQGGELCVVELLGASRDDRLPGAVVAVQSYASSLLGAAELSDRVTDAMLEITALDSVSWCGLNSAYNFTDESTGRYRYQAIFEINWYKAR